MPDDPLALIAQSYAGIHDSTRVLAQNQRLALRLQGLGLVLLGLVLLGIGVLVWSVRHESLTIQQELQRLQAQALLVQEAVMRNTQDIAAKTQALLERQEQP